jgi:hypothetical protein
MSTTIATPSAALDREVTKYVAKGFNVQSQTATTASLVKPKSFSLFLAVLLLLIMVLPFVVYLLYYVAQKDEHVFLSVDGSGRVTATRS